MFEVSVFATETKHMEIILFKVCPVTFEKHGCDYVIQGDDSKPLLEEKLMTDDVRSGQNELLEIDDVTGVNESLLSDFTCKCANMAKDKQDISMAISVEYSTVANGWYNYFYS